ncbi:HAD hydrolase-like protein [Falsirhodobacter halotolerans]|uniref:HAD hydrolase-like protein n=1 Tax=Falsirhodobacter halotolerans TaxID=1146892 RepID=UPI001FD3F50F|nr:HAD hydrolase-like protein [Falsirhodobacter halotolerans]MCJ8140204.1 HAD hydrolase-like protein [Falsirhodobacter halotolerans]
MRCVVFDLDGTLADTSADLVASANHCFRALGHGDRLHPVEDAATAVRGARAMLKLGFERVGTAFTDADIDRQFPILLEAYGQAIAVHTTLYPGAVAAVEGLRRAGVATAVCTNKPEGLAHTLLAHLGVTDLFDAMIGADTLPTRKPDAAPYLEAVRRAGGEVGRSFLVGDTETDLKTGAAAGVPVALVTFGPAGGAVAALKPDALLHRYADLEAVMDRLVR